MKVPLIFLGFWTFSAFSLFQVLPTESMALSSNETEAQTPIVGSIFPVSISNSSTAGGGHICQSKPVDLLFIIDSSRSVLLPQFHQVKRFITDVISVLHIGPLATRVGVIQYGSTVQSEFSLRDHWHKENMLAAVDVMQPLSTGTMTGLAIAYALDNAFTEEAGARPKSQGIPRVAIIVTDGRPQDKVDEVAERARRAGLELHAVGVGHAQPPALRRIASHPTEEHIHYVENYGLIERISAKFRDRLCGEDACLVVEHGCEHRCVSAGKSYVCECEEGYTLAPDGRRCLIIDPCESGKHDCEQLCVSTNDSFICRCKSTFLLNPDGRTCRSADPCAFGDHACEHICVTTEDSYTCRCRPGFVLKPDGRTCDIAETNVCLVLDHGCEHHCVSTGDSYVCTCESGYALSPDGRSCLPTDVCLLGGHGCEHLCLSIPGSFRCVCHENYILNDDGKTCQLSGFETNVCLVLDHGCEHHCVSTGDSYVCTCESGYTLSPDGRSCLPTDVCLLGGHGCEHLCLSIPGSFRCVCHENYILNDDGKTCQLSGTNVCLVLEHGCEHHCVSTGDSYVCTCESGYALATDGRSCLPTDVCLLGGHGCEHLCLSIPGSFRCVCHENYILNDDGKTCQLSGTNVCLVLEHGCEHHCVSTGDSYVCTCESGYALATDGRSCLPTDVCLLGGHGCEHLCLSIPGSFRCVCHENYILNDDGKTCQLADACSLNVHGCEHECISTGATFRCQCNVGFSLNTDGKTCRPEGCQTPLVDIVFVLDSSKSVTPEGFEAMKRFVINMVGSLDVGPGRSRVGLLQYTRRVHPQFQLGQHATASEVSEAVRGLQYYSGGTATGLALRHLTLKSFGDTADEKPKDRDVSRVAIVITDGRAQDNAGIWAERARLAGIRIFAVGVGKAVESELKAIANDPDEEHFFYGADFSTMQQIADKLKHRICIEEEHKKKRKEKVLDVTPCECNATVKFQQQVLSLVQAMDTKLQAVSKQLNKLEPQRVK